MNNNVRNEVLVLLGNEDVDEDKQIRICALIGKYINNIIYVEKVKTALDVLVNEKNNFFVEMPVLIDLIIGINKNITSSKDIEPQDMRFVIYGVLYHYLDTYNSEKLNSLNCGDLRMCFLNNIHLLLTKPKKIKMSKHGLFKQLLNCLCGDDNIKI